MRIEKIYISQLDKLLTFLKGLSEDEQRELTEGRMIIDFQIKRRKQPLLKKTFNRKSEQIPFDIQNVVAKLNGFTSREEVQNYLFSSKFTKHELVFILQKLDSVSSSKDSVEKLQNRIVETTVGYGLRTQAIEKRDTRAELNSPPSSSESDSIQ